eukprot:CAMPEP_0115711898 /NCGR_PEP_ID=MMETSP0272-20121206/73825_1 /TAXON_ID=71861 /ORGANISM="Scrippsiella trochoidea, Strain CCMP3099" /LENGTH=66 /DNA_ID=CAMNT_0003153755 /DNA_START=13 /DNA_END=209 /DNA_ORIENTATION=+
MRLKRPDLTVILARPRPGADRESSGLGCQHIMFGFGQHATLRCACWSDVQKAPSRSRDLSCAAVLS